MGTVEDENLREGKYEKTGWREEWIWPEHSIWIYNNRTIKSIKNCLKKG
jgi:hypothetical protein